MEGGYMKSNGWKVTLFAVAAAVMLSACGEDKKAKPSSPYAGIWVPQENLQEYSAHRGELLANNRNGFCEVVKTNQNRYSDRRLRMTAMLISASGEIFTYSPGQTPTAPGYREQNFRGKVDAAGVFTPGRIGPDGQVNSNYANQGFGLASQTTFNWRGENLMTFWDGNEPVSLERNSKVIIDQYAEYVVSCLKIISEYHYYQEVPARPLPTRCDPRIQRCGAPRVLPLPAQPGQPEYGPGPGPGPGAYRPGRPGRPDQVPAFRPESGQRPGFEQGPPPYDDEQE